MCLTSFNVDLARCLVTVGNFAGGVEYVATEWDRESNLGLRLVREEVVLGKGGNQ